MPSTITHCYLGLDTIKKLNKNPREIIEKNINNYKIYCQSMDVLYFYHIFLLKSNKIQDLGHKFHNNDTYKVFKYLIDLNKRNKDTALFTFISGLISHYKADSIIHPYINCLSYSNSKIKNTDKHFEIETYLDNYFINLYQNTNYKKNKHYKFIFNYTKQNIIENTINNLFKDIFNEPNMGKKYYRSINEMYFTYKYIRHDSYGIKRKIYNIIDINSFKIKRTKYLSYHFNLDNDDDYLNSNHQKWYNISDRNITSNDSLMDLYNKVTLESSEIVNSIYDYIYENKDVNLEKIIQNNSYSNGLPLK